MLRSISEKALSKSSYERNDPRKEILKTYKEYIKGVLLDGVIDYNEYTHIHLMKKTFNITHEEHIYTLKRLGCTEEKFDDAVAEGMKGSSNRKFGEFKDKTVSYNEEINIYHIEYFHGLIKTPHLHQWYEYDDNGERILYKGKEERHASWEELFYDLIHVAFLSNITHFFSEDPSNYFSYIVLFFSIWSIWLENAFYGSLYATNDIIHKVYYYWHMLGIAAMILNTESAWKNNGSWGFAVSYIAANIPMIIMYIWAAFMERRTNHNIFRLISLFVCLIPWIISVATGYYYPLWLTSLIFLELSKIIGPLFDLFPPITIDHWAERLGLFVIITLGESVLSILTARSDTDIYPPEVYIGAALGLLVSFCIKWIYFDVETDTEKKRHALIRNKLTSILFTHLHAIFAFSITVMAAGAIGIQHNIAHYYSNTTLFNETFTNSTMFDEHHSNLEGFQWLLCLGASFCLFTLFGFGILSDQLTTLKHLIPHKYRIILRLFVGSLLISFPIYISGLEGLEILATTGCVTTGLTLIELIGSIILDRSFDDIDDEESSNDEIDIFT